MVDRRFQSIDRRFQSVDRRLQSLDRRLKACHLEIRHVEVRLRAEIGRSAEETRRHFDMVAESLRDEIRVFADAIGVHSERLDHHDVRIGRLERRAL